MPPERMMVVRLDGCEAHDCDPVAAALEQFTPLAETLRPGLHAFGTRGPSRYFGGEQVLSELVAQAVADAVPSAQKVGVGTADGLFAAGLAARTGQHSAVLVVPPQHSRQFLAGLPLTSLADPVSPLHSDGRRPGGAARRPVAAGAADAGRRGRAVRGRHAGPLRLARTVGAPAGPRPRRPPDCGPARPRGRLRRGGDRPARRPDRDGGVHGQGAGRHHGGPAGPRRPRLRERRHRGGVRQRPRQPPPLAPRAPL